MSSNIKIPPPTPDFEGTPTFIANSPEPSYIPQVVISVLAIVAMCSLTIRSPFFRMPPLAKNNPILAKSIAVTSIEHCLK